MLCYVQRCGLFLVLLLLLLVTVVCEVLTCHFLQGKLFKSEATTLFACSHERQNISHPYEGFVLWSSQNEIKLKELYSYQGWFNWQLDLSGFLTLECSCRLI